MADVLCARVVEGIHLLEGRDSLPVGAPWASSFVMLGKRLARSVVLGSETRTVVALTVPSRDLAAVCIAAGWVLTRPVPELRRPADLVFDLMPGTAVRFAVGDWIVTGRFFGLRTVGIETQIHVGKSFWKVTHIREIVEAPKASDKYFGRVAVIRPHSLPTATGRQARWLAEQVCSPREVALVGTKSALTADLGVAVGLASSTEDMDTFDSMLRPDNGHRSAHGCFLIPADTFEDAVLPEQVRLTILDTSSAVARVVDAPSDIIVSVIDRSVMDEFAAEAVLKLRSMSTRIIPLHELNWLPPAGIEALAFEVWR